MKILDLYCRAGGAAMGYHRAGFEVTGVDIEDMSGVYPFTFVQADAIEYVYEHGHKFDVIHASPPCQAYTTLTNGTNRGLMGVYPDLIHPTREALDSIGKPYVIENVPSAPIRKDLMLCGEMFSLRVIRHRHFELSGISVQQPKHPKHRGRVLGYNHGVKVDGYYFPVYGSGGDKGTVPQWQGAMGINWTDNRKNIAEAIPPAYTEYIGKSIHKEE